MIRIGIILSFIGFIFFKASHSESGPQITFKKISSGDTVYSILRALNFNDDHRRSCLRENVLSPSFILSPGDLYQVRKNPESKRTEVKFYDRLSSKAFLFWREGELAGAEKIFPQYQTKTVTIEGEINGSLIESITKKGGDDLLALRFMDAFHLDFYLPRILQRGDRFRITYERLYSAGQFIRYGEVLRAELETGGRKMIRSYFPLGDTGGIFIDPQTTYESRSLYAPVDYIRISSLFQPRRVHPISGRVRAHLGMDFELPEGAPIYAAGSGKVIKKSRNRFAGNHVVIKHEGGLETSYYHLSEHIDELAPGDTVRAGELIGYNGCTGHCTKPHLHFGVKKNGRYVNPAFLIRNYSYNQKDQVPRLLAQINGSSI